MRAVVAVVQPQAVPVDGGFQVALVLYVDDDLRALPDSQRRTGNGAVVGQHPHGGLADSFGRGRDAQRVPVAVGQVDHRRGGHGRKTGGVPRELVC